MAELLGVAQAAYPAASIGVPCREGAHFFSSLHYGRRVLKRLQNKRVERMILDTGLRNPN